MKNLMILQGVQLLEKRELQKINGGWAACVPKCAPNCWCDSDRKCKQNGSSEPCFT